MLVNTKSGGNKLHGSAFEFLRNTALDARNYFAPTRAAYDRNQFGGTLGGPIRKDKAFFFLDYQGTQMTQGQETGDIAVPTLADRSGNSRSQPAHRQSQRQLPGDPAFAEARLQRVGGRTLLHGELLNPRSCLSQRAYSALAFGRRRPRP